MSKFVERHKTFRAILHIPVGLVIIFGLMINPVWGIVFWLTFLAYEFVEDFHIRDESCWDIAGALWGMAIGIIGLNIWRFLG